jgi:hypothetical protein
VRRCLLLLLFVLGTVACEGEPVTPPRDAGVQGSACASLASTPVGTLGQAVQRLHALPTPSVACFVESLPRPLPLVATRGVLSAQPASGADNPRLFFFTGQLVSSVVAAGHGAPLIEFGEWVTPKRTLKGEVVLPTDGGVPTLDPFATLGGDDGQTVCATCHRFEERSATVDGGFVSVAFRPEPGTEVPLATVRALYQACVDANDASARCALYRAVFEHGAVTQGAFDPAVERLIQ